MAHAHSSSHPKPVAFSYQVSMDWWIALLAFIYLFILISLIPLVVWQHFAWYHTIWMLVFLIGIILYYIDLFFFTSYLLTPTALLITSQLRHYTFAYREMTRIEQGGIRGLISFGGYKRFALSTRCYYIGLTNPHLKQISLSPKLRDPFINQLLQNIDSERSKRATVDATASSGRLKA